MFLPQHVLKKRWKIFFFFKLSKADSHKKQSTFIQCILVEKEENENEEQDQFAALENKNWKGEKQ